MSTDGSSESLELRFSEGQSYVINRGLIDFSVVSCTFLFYFLLRNHTLAQSPDPVQRSFGKVTAAKVQATRSQREPTSLSKIGTVLLTT